MPTTARKILVQGTAVTKLTLLSIGLLSVETRKSRNKDLKRYRQHHSRSSE